MGALVVGSRGLEIKLQLDQRPDGLSTTVHLTLPMYLSKEAQHMTVEWRLQRLIDPESFSNMTLDVRGTSAISLRHSEASDIASRLLALATEDKEEEIKEVAFLTAYCVPRLGISIFDKEDESLYNEWKQRNL